jgi:hypothetical protein
MAFWDDVKEEGTVLAFDWLRQQIGVQQTPAPVSTPAQVAAQPAAVTQVQSDQSKWITYGAIGIAALGLIALLFKGK